MALRTQRYRLGDLALVDCRGSRAPGATTEDAVGVLFVRTGVEELAVGARRVLARPGTAVVWCGAEPVRCRESGPVHSWTLLVPRSRLPGVRGGLLDGEAVTLLTTLLGTAMSAALDDRLARPVADAVVDLVAGAVRPPPDRGDRTWERVTAHAQEHLRDPRLTPERMAAAGYVSLRSLYAVFTAHQETPARYVRRLRLEGARRDLERAGPAVTVAAVASSWGFADQATFGRNFRAAYGRTPDEVRRAGR